MIISKPAIIIPLNNALLRIFIFCSFSPSSLLPCKHPCRNHCLRRLCLHLILHSLFRLLHSAVLMPPGWKHNRQGDKVIVLNLSGACDIRLTFFPPETLSTFGFQSIVTFWCSSFLPVPPLSPWLAPLLPNC